MMMMMEWMVLVEMVGPIEAFPVVTKMVVVYCCQVSYGDDDDGYDVIAHFVE